MNNVPWQLTLNFDQLWRAAWEPPPKVLHKRRARQADREGDDFKEVRPDDVVGKRLSRFSPWQKAL